MPSHILVVDDEKDLIDLFRMKFRKQIQEKLYEFSFASNGYEALDLLASNPEIQIILTDINMPKMDGLQLLKKINELSPLYKTIVVTAYGDMENIRSAMHLGAFDFIIKPINFIDLEKTVQRAIQNIHWLKEVIRKENEMSIAQEFHLSLLPVNNPKIENYEIICSCIPSTEVGGDMYDFFEIEKNKYGVLIADVSGKGVPAAFYMTLLKGIISATPKDSLSPKKILSSVNKIIYQNIKKGKFITALFGIFNTEKNEFVYSRAGHLPPFLIRNFELITLQNSKGIALGLNGNELFDETLTEESIELNEGESIILITDGYTETINNDGKEFNIYEILMEYKRKVSSYRFDEFIKELNSNFLNHKTSKNKNDDSTLIAIHRN